MIKILIILFAILKFQIVCSARRNRTQSINVDYETPCNTKYPYGDETQFNCNMLDKNTNPFPCEAQADLEKRLGKCPIERTKDTSLLNPYTDCPDYAIIPSPDAIALLPNQKPNPALMCKRCDLKLNSDGLSVLLECNNCFDVPSVHRPANSTVKDIQYKVFFVQISNYSSVEVLGAEFFN